MDVDLPAVIRKQLREAGDPSRAAGQEAYMKSEMPFFGLRVPEVRRITHSAARGLTDPNSVRVAARWLWDEATHREERYAGVALLGFPQVRGQMANVALIEHMVRTGQWWDFVDDLAHRVTDLLDAHPAGTAALVRRWSTDEDLWMRRLAILSQLQRRERVDTVLLADAIEPNRTDGEFFIRKAIGWALRDYARAAPDWVRDYVAAHELSPLSRREALKHLGSAPTSSADESR